MPPSSNANGSVFVSEDVTQLIEADEIDAAVDHLRMGGGDCWECRQPIQTPEDVSFIAHLTPSAARLGFAHFRCIPPQLIDERRSRRAALFMQRYLLERSTDSQAFVLFRSEPTPRGMLVVSPETGMRARNDNGDSATPWLDLLCEKGFMPTGLDPTESSPELLPGWELQIEGTEVRCGIGDELLYTGPLEMPREWRETVAVDGRCVVLVAGLGVCSQELGPAVAEALSDLASKGLVLAATVSVLNH